MCSCVKAYDEQELWRLVYFGGIEPSLRKEVWPFLLGHYQFGMSENERKEVSVWICDSRPCAAVRQGWGLALSLFILSGPAAANVDLD